MSDEIFVVESLAELNKILGIEAPKHPLIGVLQVADTCMPKEMIGVKSTSRFYTIMLKDGSCGLQYGRNYYDFDQGVLTFLAPGQVITTTEDNPNAKGWMLFFHPDLIRKSNLGEHIDSYNFFSYDVNEALHLSEKEEGILDDIIDKITYELDQNIDAHSQGLLVSNLELMLNYCTRFYERQFHTRTNSHSHVVTEVEQLLRSYYSENLQLESGTPSVKYFADKVNLSPNYLSDLLKKETGKNAKDLINDFVIDKAKTLLLNSNSNVNELAYNLGFNYPHYFGRLFKKKTGITPQKYREQNFN